MPSETSSGMFDVGLGVINEMGFPKKIDRTSPLAHRVMYYLLSKASRTYKAAHLLWQAGYVNDAFALGRSIYEIALQAQYLAEDPLTRAVQYGEHGAVSEYKQYLKVQRMASDPKTAFDPKKFIENFESRPDFASVKKTYEKYKAMRNANNEKWNLNYWWGDTIAALARSVDQNKVGNMGWQHDFVYSYQSMQVHASPLGVQFDVDVSADGGSAVFDCSPFSASSAYLRDKVPLDTTRCLLIIVKAAESVIGFGKTTTWDEAIKQLYRLGTQAVNGAGSDNVPARDPVDG